MWLLIINGKRYRMSKRANCRKESAGEKNRLDETCLKKRGLLFIRYLTTIY